MLINSISVTQQLNLSEDFSTEVCVICSYQLTKYHQFRRNVIWSQVKLSEFYEESKRKETSETSNEFILFEIDDVKGEADDGTLEYQSEHDDLLSEPIVEVKQELDSESENILLKEEVTEAIQNHQTNVEKRKLSGKTG